VKLVFDDGHDTGLYSWKYLHELGRERDRNWAEYRARIERALRADDAEKKGPSG
jgi:DUF971 family protein